MKLTLFRSVKRILPLFVLVATLASSARAIPEADYDAVFDSRVKPFFESQGVNGSFAGKGGVPLRYRAFERAEAEERGAVVFLSGRTESFVKYAELIYDLRDEGYSIYLLDHRGQGFSGRMTKNPQVGYVRRFNDYVEDQEAFVRQVVLARPHRKVFLLAHSLGGAIGALLLERLPEVFAAAVLSSPMLELNTGSYSEAVAYLVSAGACLFGQGKKYALGQSGFDPAEPFEGNGVTQSAARFARAHRIIAENPGTELGGSSYRWVKESIQANWKIQQVAENVRTPVLLFQAGDDPVVRPGGQDRFCQAAAACSKVEFPGALHELLTERDAIRDRALSELVRFFRDYSVF